ncbi:hypothetical protein AVEN_218520-1 [Araneus ventricosus]|uniref:Prokineticin domain-containing protein n=1 Tax=Araneus ventricosus TaxID=182803 RepID=A0A4Y2JLJ5_ARAVE|nr:hypothetical protein AVEN_218520-1 [Araneus ventricosus]
MCDFHLQVVEVTAPPPDPPPRDRRPPRPIRPPRPPRPNRGTRPPRPIRPQPKLCDTAEDCEADQCCVQFGPFFFRKGRCVKLSSEGNCCSPEELAENGKYIRHCPCAEGLHCDAKKVVETKIGKVRINDRCVKPGPSTVQPDEETTDSGSNQSEET